MSLAIVDISEDNDETSSRIYEAFQNTGAVIITGMYPDILIDTVFEKYYEFLKQPLIKKNIYSTTEHSRNNGYISTYDCFNFNEHRSDTSAPQDLMQYCNMYISLMNDVAEKLVQLSGITGMKNVSTSVNLLNYSKAPFGSNAHRFLTLTAIDGHSQIWNSSTDTWIDVPKINGFLVTVGNILSTVTNGEFKNTFYQVQTSNPIAGISFFYEPAHNYIVKREAMPDITYQEYISICK